MPYTNTKQRVMQSLKDFYRFLLKENKKVRLEALIQTTFRFLLKKLDAWLSIALTQIQHPYT